MCSGPSAAPQYHLNTEEETREHPSESGSEHSSVLPQINVFEAGVYILTIHATGL